MTQTKEQESRIAALYELFLTLDDQGQENAIAILRALRSTQCIGTESNRRNGKDNDVLQP